MLGLEEATEVSVVSVAPSLFVYLSSVAVLVVQQQLLGEHPSVPALRLLSPSPSAGYESGHGVCHLLQMCVVGQLECSFQNDGTLN